MKINIKKFGLRGNIEITKDVPKTEVMEITGLFGAFELKLYGPDGYLKDYRYVKNLTTNDGFDTVGELMGIGTPSPTIRGFNFCAIGEGATIGVGQNTLLAERARVVGGYTGTDDTHWKNDATFGAGVGTGAIKESGLMNTGSLSPTENTMLCGQTFAVINKGADDTLVVTWSYTLS